MVMNIKKMLLFVSLVTFSICYTSLTYAQLDSLLKGMKKTLGFDQELSTSKIVAGLKEALRVGTENAVGTLSKPGGYLDNPKIRIPLPESVQKVDGLLRAAGFGPQLDEFDLSMNRAAEAAAPEAKSIFWDAITGMTFEDAREILQGRENEATLYFKDKTHDPLKRVFKPIVHDSMSRVGATRSYQALEDKSSRIPFAGDMDLSLDDYVTDKALDGLFYTLGREEIKIRQNPSARVTDLLKEVFGN
jgi:hypothetical protein